MYEEITGRPSDNHLDLLGAQLAGELELWQEEEEELWLPSELWPGPVFSLLSSCFLLFSSWTNNLFSFSSLCCFWNLAWNKINICPWHRGEEGLTRLRALSWCRDISTITAVRETELVKTRQSTQYDNNRRSNPDIEVSPNTILIQIMNRKLNVWNKFFLLYYYAKTNGK